MDLCLCWMEWTRDEGLLKVFSIEKLLNGLIPPGQKKLEREYVLSVGGKIYTEENLAL